MIPARILSPSLTLGAGLRLEELLTHADGFGLTTATPAQRAVCRIADGLPLGDLATHPDVLRCVGDVGALPTTSPAEMTVVLGIRAFKSKLTAAAAIQATQICDLTFAESEIKIAGTGEYPRVPCVSLDKGLAHVVFAYVKGYVESKPALRSLLVCPPTADTVTLRHPSGTPIEIVVSAGRRAGGSLIGRWLASAIFDEAPRMLGQEDAIVNLDDSLQAIRGRILPRGKIWKVGSPWAAEGPVYDEVKRYEGKPTRTLVVVRGPAYLFNPYWWTPARIEDIRKKDPDAYLTDVEAEFHTCVALAALPPVLIDACVSVEQPPVEGMCYTAAIDPATRGNAWALVIGHRDRWGVHVIDLVSEWQGTRDAPLSVRATFAEIAAVCKPYAIDALFADQWSVDANREIAAEFDMRIREVNMGGADKFLVVKSILGWLADKQIQFPAGVLVEDLKRVKRVVTRGGISIDMPTTSDGRHCDAAAAAFVLLHKGLDEPDSERAVKPREGTPEYVQAQADDMRQRAFDRNRARKERRWYEQ